MKKEISSQPLTTSDAAAENRRRMPLTAVEIDGWRLVFGEVKVLWVMEDGVEVGRRPPEGVPASASPPKSSKRA